VKQQVRNRGGRVSRRGFQLFWAGALMLPALLVAGIVRAPGPVIGTLMALLFLLCVSGLAVVLAGSAIGNRDLAEYHRKVAAGEIPPWRPTFHQDGS
jgi:hypothetical protein